MKILNLTIKKQWFDMILSGAKPEEYRVIKPYWIVRLIEPTREIEAYDELCDDLRNPTHRHHSFADLMDFFDCKVIQFDAVRFVNGGHFNPSLPNTLRVFKGLDIGIGQSSLGAPNYPVFKILLGDEISRGNINPSV